MPVPADRLPALSPMPTGSEPGTAKLIGHYKPGSRIGGRYEVVRVFEGGMGLVYLCIDHENGASPVALKTFKPQFLSDRSTRDRFLREGTIWVALGKHPNIVHAHRVERWRNGLEVYLVLEWVAALSEELEDASLRAILHKKKYLPLAQALKFGLHIARGMRHATTQIPGLVHQDLKPENVLVGRDGNVRVTDFGLASVLAAMPDSFGESGMHIRTSGGGVGTPLYMAPEQWKRHTTIDIRADIYAFGCILYEMLTGHLAVSGKTPTELSRAHQLGWVNPLPKTVPAEVQALVRGCMATAPEQRFQSWQDVEKAISLVVRHATGKLPPLDVSTGDESNRRHERIAAGWSYNAVGLSYRDIGNHDLAAGYFERVVWVGQQEQEISLLSAGLRHLGDAYRALGDLDSAVKYHRKHALLAKKMGDVPRECDAFGSLGKDYMRLGNFQQAMAQFQTQLSLIKTVDDPQRKCMVLSNVGDAHLALNQFDDAMTVYKKALSLAREIENRLIEGRILGNIGRIYVEQEQPEIAEPYLEKALSITREVGDRSGEGMVMGYLGQLYLARNNQSRALWYLVNQLAITQETRDQMTEMEVLTVLGDVYVQLKSFEQAIESYHSALTIARAQNNQTKVVYLLEQLGYSYFKEGESSPAIGYYEEGLSLAQQIDDPMVSARLARGVAQVYYSINDYWRTRERYEQALSLAKAANELGFWAQSSREFAVLLARQNNRDRAIFYAQEAIRLFESIGDTENVKLAKDTLSRIKNWWRKL